MFLIALSSASDLCSLVLCLVDLKNPIWGLLFIFWKMKKALVYLKEELGCFVSAEEPLQ